MDNAGCSVRARTPKCYTVRHPWVFGSGENRSAHKVDVSGCSVRVRT